MKLCRNHAEFDRKFPGNPQFEWALPLDETRTLTPTSIVLYSLSRRPLWTARIFIREFSLRR